MKPTLRLILSLSIAALVATSCSDASNIVHLATGTRIEATGPMARQTRSLSSPVSALSVSAGLTVEYVQDDSAKIVVEAPENILDIISTTVSSGTLSVSPTKGFSTKAGQTVRIIVYAPSIDSFSASAGSSILCSSITAQSIRIQTSAGATGSIDGIKASSVQVSASAGSTISLSGSTSTVALTASAGASISASALKALSGSASASAGGSISSNIVNPRISTSAGGAVNNK